MKIVAIAAAVALLVLPVAALALRFEGIGNGPMAEQPDWPAGVVNVVNLESRVYHVGGGGNDNFFYRGDVLALEEAIKKFAAVKSKDERRVVLLPGRGKTHSFDGKAIDFDWQLHVPRGRFLAAVKDARVVLTIHINAESPRNLPDRKKAGMWVRDLDDDSFEARERASRELEGLGVAAKPLLRETLKGSPSPEVRRRVGRLLAKLKGRGLDAGDLGVPVGVKVVTASDLLAEHFEGLKDADKYKCSMAISGLSELAPYSDKVVGALVGMLGKGKDEYVRRNAAWGVGRIGAKAALPALREGLGDADKNVRAAFRDAVAQIEKDKEDPGWGEEVKRRRVILKDLDEWKKNRGK